MNTNKKILLHACCGPCATHCIEALRKDGIEPVLFFSNSNIMPEEEYNKRLEAIKKLAELVKVELVIDKYDNEAWRGGIAGYENEPEGGKRCTMCFTYNLSRAARYATKNGFTSFTTTLTVSPHKNSEQIFCVGDMLAEVATEQGTPLTFEHYNFKKQNGFLNSVRLAKEYELYRQSYCGCYYSIQKNTFSPSN
jgi:predicted adenine nucleotide alpha hydrolase (AANH) superfamily ATPase